MFTLPKISSLDELSVGEERMQFNVFFRKYYKFRLSDLSPRFTPFPEDIQLPLNSILHLLDNMYRRDNNQTLSDLPYLDIPFVKNEQFRKFIYHIQEPNVTEEGLPIQLPKDFVFRNMNLYKNLQKFRRENGSKFRFIKSVEELNPSPNTLTIINYNPLFRTLVRGVLPVYRQFKVVLGTVLNTAAKIPDKQQYIIIPLSHHIYQRDKFRMAEKNENTASIKSPNSYHYFCMMHWLNFISTTSDLSLFESYPKELWDKTTIVFTVGLEKIRYAMMWTLADAVKLNERNKMYPRYVNQINSLILSDMGSIVSSSDDDTDGLVESNIDKVVNDKKLITETASTSEVKTQIPVEDLVNLEISESDIKELDLDTKINKEIIKLYDAFSESVAKSVSSNTPINISKIHTSIVPEIGTTVIPKIDDLNTKNTPENSTNDTINFIFPTNIESGDLSKITPHKTEKDTENFGKNFLSDLDTNTEELINSNINLTNKQRERIRNIMNTSKSVKLNGKTIEEHLTQPVDPKLNTNNLGFLDNQIPDKSMLTSSISNFDSVYMNNFFEKDLAAIAVSFSDKGMFLVGIEENLYFDELNRVRKFKFSYEDINGKKHTVKFDLPYIDETGLCLINGISCRLKKQMANLPICKVSPTRISLASNYNKTIVERNEAKAHNFLAYIKRLINKINSDDESTKINITYGINTYNEKLSYEYTQLASIYNLIDIVDLKGNTFSWIFELENRFSLLKKEVSNIEKLEYKYGVFFGNVTIKSEKTSYLLFIHTNNIITVYNSDTDSVHSTTTFIDMLSGMFDTKLSKPLSEWTDIKILDKKFPVGFLLCFEYGITHTLNYLNVNYSVEPKRGRLNLRATDITIPFADKVLVIPRYPFRNSLIIAGLLMFNTKDYLLEDFDSKDVYYKLLIDKGFKTNYLKGIEDTFKLFVDPITRDVLEQMNEPTTFKDLLIRSTDMLTTDLHYEASSMANHRLRSYERLNAIVYNEMSRQYAAFHRKSGAGNTFSINPNAVLQRVLQDQSMILTEDINPIHEIKTTSGFTYSGMGGRTAQSFVVNDRRYPDDGVGIISEATPDSGAVAITATAPADATLANIRGLPEVNDFNKLEPSQILSAPALLMPGVTQDD